MNEKIKKAAEVIDKWLNWTKIASGIENKMLRYVVGAIEMIDSLLIRSVLNLIIQKIPEQFLPVVEKYLDAIIAEDLDQVAITTGDFVNVIVDIPFLEEEQEAEVLHAIFLAIVKMIPRIFEKKDAA